VAPHEEETFINFVKKFELKRDEDGNPIEETDKDKNETDTPRRGRGGRVIKKRKLGYVEYYQ
jgi:hypothetical protein